VSDRVFVDTVFIDTVFVVALINRRDQYHSTASALAQEYDGCPLLTTDAVFLEVGNALASRFRQEAVEVIEDFFDAEEVEIVRLSPKLFEDAFNLFKSREDKSWTLVDCVSFVVMWDAKIHDALTSDQHFVQAGFRALMLE